MRPIDLRARLRRLEAAWIRRALAATGGDVRAASRLLGHPERTLWYRIRALGVYPDRYRAQHSTHITA